MKVDQVFRGSHIRRTVLAVGFSLQINLNEKGRLGSPQRVTQSAFFMIQFATGHALPFSETGNMKRPGPHKGGERRRYTMSDTAHLTRGLIDDTPFHMPLDAPPGRTGRAGHIL